MPHKHKLPPNAACPCGSGKEYGDCCHDKGFDWMVDEDGNIGKSVPVSDELAEVIKQQHQKFVEEFGREPGPEDNLFFNMPHQEVVEHVMVEGMKQAGLDPAIIYAFEKTGLMVTEANEHLISDVDRAAWAAAVREYRTKQWEESGEKENEWF
jgi:hypothetical protein